MQDAAIRDSVQSAQEEYNLSLKDLSLKALKAAHALLGDLDPGRPDGTAKLRKANARFAKPNTNIRGGLTISFATAEHW